MKTTTHNYHNQFGMALEATVDISGTTVVLYEHRGRLIVEVDTDPNTGDTTVYVNEKMVVGQ